MNTTTLQNLSQLLPELILAGTAFGVILAEILAPRAQRSLATPFVASLGLLVALAVLLLGRADLVASAAEHMVRLVSTNEEGVVTSTYLVWRPDAFAWFARALVAAVGLLVVLLSIPYTRRMDRGHGEFYALLLFALLGVMLVSGVADLLTLFVCLELVTISSYVLAAFKRNDLRATEAGLKYLVIGAVSSAVLLLGIAFTYGAVGDVTFAALRAAVLQGGAPPILLVTGLLFVLIGILFKVGAVPFHVWIPDVYQGAPSPVVAFLSTGSKTAGLVLLLRLAGDVFVPWATQGHGLLWVWLLGGLAAITIVFGLLGALPQRSMKRFFGYSSIGHAGYLLIGAAAIASWGEGGQPDQGATAMLFYLLAFVFTNLTAFTVIVLVSRATGGRHEAIAYQGLWKRAPFLALAMALALLSLAGIPPLSGFFGKFLILSSAVNASGTAGWGLMALAFLGAVGVAVSLYFYLRWIREMYFEAPEPIVADVKVPVGPWAGIVLAVGIAAMLAMGVFMPPFYELAKTAAAAVVGG